MRGMREMRETRVKCLDESEATIGTIASSMAKRFTPYMKKYVGLKGKIKSFYTGKNFRSYSSPCWEVVCTYNLEFPDWSSSNEMSKKKSEILSKFSQIAKVEARGRGYSINTPTCHIISLHREVLLVQVDIYVCLQSNAMRKVKALDVSYTKAPSLTEADLHSFIQHTEKLQRMIKAYLKAVKDQVGPGAFHLIERYLVSPQIMDQSITNALPILKKYTRLLKIQSGKTNPHNIPGHRGFYRAVGMPLKSSSLLNSKKRIQGQIGLPSGVPVPSNGPTF